MVDDVCGSSFGASCLQVRTKTFRKPSHAKSSAIQKKHLQHTRKLNLMQLQVQVNPLDSQPWHCIFPADDLLKTSVTEEAICAPVLHLNTPTLVVWSPALAPGLGPSITM